MDTLRSPADTWTPTLFNVAVAAREMLEHAWSPDTAYQGIVLQPEDPASRGQCGVSALWLSRYLQGHDIEAYFTEGIIRLDGLSDEHVWVEARKSGKSNQIIDLTSDQYGTVNRALVHVGEYDSGPGTIGSYEPLQYFSPDQVPRRKLLARFAILEANIAKLPRRHRMKQHLF
jgi:hypothetical protein